jgi:TPR repeat protein
MWRMICLLLFCTACVHSERVELCRLDKKGDQCTNFGHMYSFEGDEDDLAIAADFYRSACDKKYGEGCYRLLTNQAYIVQKQLNAEQIQQLKDEACYNSYMPACQDLGARDAKDLRNQRNRDKWIEQCKLDPHYSRAGRLDDVEFGLAA